MLVLTRQRDEQLVLEDRQSGKVIARFRVVDIRGDKVRIGVTAGDDVIIDREEVHEVRRQLRASELAKHAGIVAKTGGA